MPEWNYAKWLYAVSFHNEARREIWRFIAAFRTKTGSANQTKETTYDRDTLALRGGIPVSAWKTSANLATPSRISSMLGLAKQIRR